jgi:hypothetical protein
MPTGRLEALTPRLHRRGLEWLCPQPSYGVGRLGGPGAPHESRQQPEPSKPRGERPENTKSARNTSVSGGGGERIPITPTIRAAREASSRPAGRWEASDGAGPVSFMVSTATPPCTPPGCLSLRARSSRASGDNGSAWPHLFIALTWSNTTPAPLARSRSSRCLCRKLHVCNRAGSDHRVLRRAGYIDQEMHDRRQEAHDHDDRCRRRRRVQDSHRG